MNAETLEKARKLQANIEEADRQVKRLREVCSIGFADDDRSCSLYFPKGTVVGVDVSKGLMDEIIDMCILERTTVLDELKKEMESL